MSDSDYRFNQQTDLTKVAGYTQTNNSRIAYQRLI